MALEAATYLDDLDTANPTATDLVQDGDDHIRLLKTVIKTTFPSFTRPFYHDVANAGTADVVAVATDDRSTISIDATGGNKSVTLPDSPDVGYELTVLKSDASGNTVTIARAGSNTINGTTSYVISSQFGSVKVKYLGSNVWIILFKIGAASSADVVGPASATDNALARFDTTTGKLLQDSGVTLSDTNELSLTSSGAIDLAGITAIHSGTSLKWSHSNTNFIGTLGALSGGGAPFLALHAAHSATASTLKNSGAGVKGVYLIHAGSALNLIWNGVATADADFSAAVTAFSITDAGVADFGVELREATRRVYSAGGPDVAVTDGGTGASSAAAALTNLGIGTTDIPQFRGVMLVPAANATQATSTTYAFRLRNAADTTDYLTIGYDGLTSIIQGWGSVALDINPQGNPVKVNGALVKTVGVETIYVPAGAMVTRTTNGAATGTAEMTTNKQIFKTFDFDTTTQEFVQFTVRVPKAYDLGTITAEVVWSHASTTTNFGVVWAIEAVALSNDDAGDVSFGTAQQIADTGGTTNDIYITGTTPAITIGGTPAAEDWVVFQVKRVPSDGSDTMAIDARLHGVTINFTTNAATDA